MMTGGRRIRLTRLDLECWQLRKLSAALRAVIYASRVDQRIGRTLPFAIAALDYDGLADTRVLHGFTLASDCERFGFGNLSPIAAYPAGVACQYSGRPGITKPFMTRRLSVGMSECPSPALK